MMMTEICNDLKNFFVPENKKSDMSYIHKDIFTISDGEITGVDFLLPNQYFRIVGSVFNDGVCRNNSDDLQKLTNETFDGAVWEMAVPKSFLELCTEIQKFNEKINELSANDKGYISESFGGYSYSLGSNVPAYMQSLQNRLNSELNHYRRLRLP